MQQVIMCKGLPASGKSTWAKDHVKKNASQWKRVNRDELRLMIDAGEWSPQNEKFIVEARNQLMMAALRKGFNVVIDDTNLRDENFEDVCTLVERENKEVMVLEKCFPIDIDVAVERDKLRGAASVGEKVIMNMWKKNIRGKQDFFRPKVQHYFVKQLAALSQDTSLPKAVICDLDGTLALIGDRSPYNAANCDKVDFPNPPVVEAVKLFHEAGYKILFVSGREDKDRDATMRFIAKHVPEVCNDWFHSQVARLTSAYKRLTPSKTEEKQLLELELEELTTVMVQKLRPGSPGSILLMRSTDDKRKDTIVKKEIWDRNIGAQYNVLCAIDDRPTVCRMWRYEVGLPVMQVNDREF